MDAATAEKKKVQWYGETTKDVAEERIKRHGAYVEWEPRFDKVGELIGWARCKGRCTEQAG